MTTDFVSLHGLLLMFILGLRHGLDPDHIAVIDNMAYRNLLVRPSIAPWVGTLFALGHGLAVTVIAVVIGSFKMNISIPNSMILILEWLPILLLFIIGTLNLWGLFRKNDYRAMGWKKFFIPKWLRNSSHPLAIFLVGVIFALVFDTTTQAAAWGYAATTHSGIYSALLVGLVFTAGMVITDTLDGRLMVRLLGCISNQSKVLIYRRRIGWIVVGLSYGIVLYAIATYLYPAFELNDTMLTVMGAALFSVLLISYIFVICRSVLSSNQG